MSNGKSNLIDFLDSSTDDKNTNELNLNQNFNELPPPLIASPVSKSSSDDNNVLKKLLRSNTIDSNPFDKLQEQAELYDDPFEIVMRNEIQQNNDLNLTENIKHQQRQNQLSSVNVPTENLIIIDSQLENDQLAIDNNNNNGINSNNKEKKRIQSDSDVSTQKLNNIGKFHSNSVDQLLVSKKSNLLKLSIANASLELLSPSNHNKNKNTILIDENLEASRLAHRLTNVSIRSISGDCDSSTDDIMSTKPNWNDSETDCDSDFEQMKIPFLKNLNIALQPENALNEVTTTTTNVIDGESNNFKSSAIQPTILADTNKIIDKYKNSINQKSLLHITHDRHLSSPEEIDLMQSDNLNALLNKVKNAVKHQCDNIEKQTTAQKILDDLSAVFKTKNTDEPESPKTPTEQKIISSPQPQPIKREGTFEVDKRVVTDDCNGEQMMTSPQSISSSSSSSSSSSNTPEFDSDLTNIIEKIGSVFGNNHLNVIQTNELPVQSSQTSSKTADNTGTIVKPTYIVIMGTPSSRKSSSSTNNHDMENNLYHPRVRSNSLNVHDYQNIPHINTNVELTEHRTGATKSISRRSSFSTTNVNTIEKSNISTKRRVSLNVSSTISTNNNSNNNNHNYSSPTRLTSAANAVKHSMIKNHNTPSTASYLNAKTPRKSIIDNNTNNNHRPQYNYMMDRTSVTPSKLQKIRARAQPETIGITTKKGPMKAIQSIAINNLSGKPVNPINHSLSNKNAINASTPKRLPQIQITTPTSSLFTPSSGRCTGTPLKFNNLPTSVLSGTPVQNKLTSSVLLGTPVSRKPTSSRLSMIATTPQYKSTTTTTTPHSKSTIPSRLLLSASTSSSLSSGQRRRTLSEFNSGMDNKLKEINQRSPKFAKPRMMTNDLKLSRLQQGTIKNKENKLNS